MIDQIVTLTLKALSSMLTNTNIGYLNIEIFNLYLLMNLTGLTLRVSPFNDTHAIYVYYFPVEQPNMGDRTK